jgi:hypothetical protein
MVHYDLRDVP